MNKSYRVIWSDRIGNWVVASEIAHAQGKHSGACVTVTAQEGGGQKLPWKKGVIAQSIGLILALVTAGPVWADYSAGSGSTTGAGNAGAIAIGGGTGFSSYAQSDYAIAIGNNAYAYSNSSTAFGSGAKAGVSGSTTAGGAGSGAYALGNDANAAGTSSVAIGGGDGTGGGGSSATGDRAVAVGRNSSASGTNSIAIGGASGTTSGAGANASANNAVSIGSGSSVSLANSVALGSGSVASAVTATTTWTTANGVVSGSTFAVNQAPTNGVVAIGNRQIQGVADGEVSATSTNAINGSQLYKVAVALDTEISSLSTSTSTGISSLSTGLSTTNSTVT